MKKLFLALSSTLFLAGCNMNNDDVFNDQIESYKTSKENAKNTRSSLSVNFYEKDFRCGGGVPVTSNGEFVTQTFFNLDNPSLAYCKGCKVISAVLIDAISNQFSIDKKFYQTDAAWMVPQEYSSYEPMAQEYIFEYIDSSMPYVTFPYSGPMPASTVQGLVDDSILRVQDFINLNPYKRIIAITAHPYGYLCSNTNRGVSIKIKYTN